MAGEIVALPTDTVPGLAVRADLEQAASRLAELKGTPADRPFTLHLGKLDTLTRWAPSLPPGMASWLVEFLPLGVTAVLRRDWLQFPDDLPWPWESVGLRLPTHPQFQHLARKLGHPLLMTSVNPSGEEPLWGEDLALWLQRMEIPAAKDLETGGSRTPSSVVAFTPLPQSLRACGSGSPGLPGKRVLVLCSGNICRSPIGEALLRDAVAKAWQVPAGRLHELGWVFASAGTIAMSGGPLSDHSLTAGQEIGLELSAHRSQHLDEALRQPWDLVLGMGPRHLQGLAEDLPAELFDPAGQAVPDPFGGNLDDYQTMRDHLLDAVGQRMALWSAWPNS